jgi:hypothetical protein
MTARMPRHSDGDEQVEGSRFAPQTLFSCADTVALVTGGATGIGAACAEALGAAGAAVGIVGLPEPDGERWRGCETPEAAAQRLRRSGIRAVGIGSDITDSDQLAGQYRMWRQLSALSTPLLPSQDRRWMGPVMIGFSSWT